MSVQKAIKSQRNPSEYPTTNKNFIQGYQKSLTKLTSGKIKQHVVKRSKPYHCKFEDDLENQVGEGDCDDEIMKQLAKALEPTNKIQKLDITCLLCCIKDEGFIMICERIKKLTSLKSLKLTFTSESEWEVTDLGTKKLGMALKSLSHLRDLSLQFSESHRPGYPTDYGIHHLSKDLGALPSLRNLNLDFLLYNQNTDKEIKCLSRTLSKLVLLQSLRLNFAGMRFKNFTSPGLLPLFTALKKLKRLQNMSLNFQRNFGNGEVEIFPLVEVFKALGSLKEVSLRFSVFGLSMDTKMCRLEEGLKSLTALQKLNLSFTGCPIEIESLGQSLKALPDLQIINLNFGRGLEITYQEMVSLDRALEDLIQQKAINLDFKLHDTTETIDNLCQGFDLKSFSSLRTIAFNFDGDHSIRDEKFMVFCQGLGKLVSLKTLSLKFHYHVDISNLQLQYLSQGLEKLASLETLSIYLDSCAKISDLQHFSQSLKKLISLKSLTLSCSACVKANFEPLGESLMALTSLETLNMDFSFCDENRSLSAFCQLLGESLKKLTLLQTVHLNFDGYNHFSELDIQFLAEGLQTVGSLKDLRLTFANKDLRKLYGEMKDEVIYHLSKAIKKNAFLQKLRLDLRNCHRITDKGAESLIEAVKTLGSLKFVYLSFYSFYGISPTGKFNLLQALKMIPNCEVHLK